jgi:hypothetical protein
MTKAETYRQSIQTLEDWTLFLKQNSGLPGPRGNLELAHVVAENGNQEQFEHFLSFDGTENTPEVFVLFCGVLGLGKLAAVQPEIFDRLRTYASDPRWRIREAVATGLQLAGDQNMELLIREMKQWIKGNWYEKRAAAAALAEPRLLRHPNYAKQALHILDKITADMETEASSKDEGYKVLRQGMGYCWSVAVVALPEVGKARMEKWLGSPDQEVRRIMKENLKKNRLVKMDADWVKQSLKKLD